MGPCLRSTVSVDTIEPSAPTSEGSANSKQRQPTQGGSRSGDPHGFAVFKFWLAEGDSRGLETEE